MEDKELKQLNILLNSYVSDESFLFEDFDIIKKLNDYIIEIPFLPDTIKKDRTIRLNQSYGISCDFLKTIDQRYYRHLKNRWESGIFDFSFEKNPMCAETYYDEDKQSNVIYLPIKNTLEDSFSITHEIIHEMNLSEDNFSFSFYVLCEALSVLSEFLQEDYLNNTKYKGFLRNKRDIFQAVINYKSKKVDIELYLLNKYTTNGYVTKYDIRDYIINKSKSDRELCNMFINNILYTDELSIDVEQRNIIGIFFASYMHDRILKDPKKINEFITINDNLNEMDLYDIFKLIDIDVYDEETGDLTNHSYQKLFKSYSNELSRIK